MTMQDPWRDAADIAERLQQPEGALVVVIGARAWCARCRQLHPAFERLARRAGTPNTVWLWLDLEDHAEFLGGFILDDLPLLLHFREGQLIESGVVAAMSDATWQLRALPQSDALPLLWRTFAAFGQSIP